MGCLFIKMLVMTISSSIRSWAMVRMMMMKRVRPMRRLKRLISRGDQVNEQELKRNWIMGKI